MGTILALIGVLVILFAIGALYRPQIRNRPPEHVEDVNIQRIEHAEQARALMTESRRRREEEINRERQQQQQLQKLTETSKVPERDPIDIWIEELNLAIEKMWPEWESKIRTRAASGYGDVDIKWEPDDINFAITEGQGKTWHDYGSTLWERKTGAQLVTFFSSRGFEIGSNDYTKFSFVTGKVDISRGLNDSEYGYFRPYASFVVKW